MLGYGGFPGMGYGGMGYGGFPGMGYGGMGYGGYWARAWSYWWPLWRGPLPYRRGWF